MITYSTSRENMRSLTWPYQPLHVLEGLKNLLGQNDDLLLTDVTLACDGEFVNAHKLILSICSSFFRDLFMRNKADKSNTIVILGNVSASNLRYLLQFIYQGKVDIPSPDVESFLQAGKMLKIEGLCGSRSGANETEKTSKETDTTDKDEIGNNAKETNSGIEASGSFPGKRDKQSINATSTSSGPSSKKAKISGPVPEEEELIIEEVKPVEDPLGNLEANVTENVEGAEDSEPVIDLNRVKTETIEVISGFQDHPLEINSQKDVSCADTVQKTIPVLETHRPPREALPSSSSRISTAQPPKKKGYGRRPNVPLNKGERTSHVWKYFGDLSPGYSKCTLCKGDIKIIKTEHGTKALLNHLKSFHVKEFEEIQEMKEREEEERRKRILSIQDEEVRPHFNWNRVCRKTY